MYKISIGDTYSFALLQQTVEWKKKCLIFISSKNLNDKKYQCFAGGKQLHVCDKDQSNSPKVHSAMLEVHLQNDDKKPKQKTKQYKTKQTKQTKRKQNNQKPYKTQEL